MKNQVENNKLIAEFMGFLIDGKFAVIEDEGNPLEEAMLLEEMEYHKSWDWLMPVVEKCYNTDILEERNVEYEPSHSENLMGDITHALVDINLQKTHEAVVEFIKWYNERIQDEENDKLIERMHRASNLNETNSEGGEAEEEMPYEVAKKKETERFNLFTDEELQLYNGDNEETLKHYNRQDAIEEAVETSLNEAIEEGIVALPKEESNNCK